MTTINGAHHHNVEELLASIRTSMSENEGPARLVAGDMNLPARREQTMAEEAAEFELPAIFKPGHMPASDRPKLFGRLSEALKAAPVPDEETSRTVIPFDPALSSTRMLEPPSAARMQAKEPAQPPAADAQPVARVMPTFFDTRINRMGELTRAVFEPPAPEPQPEPEPLQAQQPAQPPALPAKTAQQASGEGADDAAAQLLRPMLRAWLHENMPKIVEKALLSEVQGQPPQKPRK